MSNFKKTRIPKFRRFVLQNFPFIEEDFDALTDYALICKVIEYLNEVIKSTNESSAQVENLTNLYEILKSRIDNLDLQDEVNQKIESMVESGELQSIISQFASLIQVYDTQTSLLADSYLTTGYAKTLGLITKGDGFGALYKIDTTGDLELASGAYATLISNIGGNNYYNFESKIERHYNTTCYITTIPVNDANGNQINPYVDLCPEGPLEYSQDHNTSLTINASLGIHTVISNGTVISDHDASNYKLPDAAVYLALKADRSLADYQANLATGPNMIADGATQAWLAFYRLITNNTFADWSWVDEQWTGEGSGNIATSRHPRQCIGQKNDKTIVILTTDGRRTGEYGLTSEECATILHNEGCTNAWNLDGGGSTSTSIKGYKINGNIDMDYTIDRNIDACLNIKNIITNEELANVNANIGRVAQMNNEKIMKVLDQAIVDSVANKSLNTLADRQGVNYVVGATDSPSSSGYLVTIPNTLPQFFGKYASQLFINRENGRLFTRNLTNEVFGDWKPSEGYIAHLYSRSNNYYSVVDNDTYEDITFDNNIIYTNVDGYKNNLITVTENNEIVFNGNMSRVLLEITFDLTTTGTAGSRHFRLVSGSSEISNSHAQFAPTGALSVTTRTVTALTTISNPIKMQIYGKTGDRVGRIKVIARSFD